MENAQENVRGEMIQVGVWETGRWGEHLTLSPEPLFGPCNDFKGR